MYCNYYPLPEVGTRHIFVTASCCFIDVSRITVVFFGGIFPTSSPFRVTRYTWYVVRNNNTQSYSLLRRFQVVMSTRTVGNCIQISSFVYALNVGNSRHIFVASSDKEFFFYSDLRHSSVFCLRVNDAVTR